MIAGGITLAIYGALINNPLILYSGIGLLILGIGALFVSYFVFTQKNNVYLRSIIGENQTLTEKINACIEENLQVYLSDEEKKQNKEIINNQKKELNTLSEEKLKNLDINPRCDEFFLNKSNEGLVELDKKLIKISIDSFREKLGDSPLEVFYSEDFLNSYLSKFNHCIFNKVDKLKNENEKKNF